MLCKDKQIVYALKYSIGLNWNLRFSSSLLMEFHISKASTRPEIQLARTFYYQNVIFNQLNSYFKFAEVDKILIAFPVSSCVSKNVELLYALFSLRPDKSYASLPHGGIFTCYNGKPGSFNTLLQCLPQLFLWLLDIFQIIIDHQTLINLYCSQSYPRHYYCRKI